MRAVFDFLFLCVVACSRQSEGHQFVEVHAFSYFSRYLSVVLQVLLSILFPPQIQHKTLQSRKRNGIEHNEH